MRAYYLYLWNPKGWTWLDYADAVCRVNNSDEYVLDWNCANTEKIKIGDIFFLMRLGEEPKGIIGCGYIVSVPYKGPHWDKKKLLLEGLRIIHIYRSKCYLSSPISQLLIFRS